MSKEFEFIGNLDRERNHLNKWQFKTQIMAEIELTEREELEIMLENLNKREKEEERKQDYKVCQ
jgi:hypothetical protein